MPGLDGTGPMGQGSQTGRGLGRCNPANNTEINENIQRPMGGAFGRGYGRGMGRGMGRGFGGRGFRRNWDTAPITQNDKEKK